MRNLLATALLFTVAAASARAASLPKRVGMCSQTTISAVTDRFGESLEPSGDGLFGTSVQYKNGGAQFSYRLEPTVAASRKGDAVLVCLVEVPAGCTKGDDRAKVYTTTNLRTQASWTLADSQHMCGGA